MSNFQKYVNLVFLSAGGLVWLVTNHYIKILVAFIQSRGSIPQNVSEVVIVAVPIALGLATFVLLRNNIKALNFTTDSVGELTKMTWPGPKETRLGTIVVIITVVLAALFFFAVDWSFDHFVQFLIGVKS